MLSHGICQIFKNTYFEEHLQTTASVLNKKCGNIHSPSTKVSYRKIFTLLFHDKELSYWVQLRKEEERKSIFLKRRKKVKVIKEVFMYLNESSPKWSKRDPGCYMGQIIQEWTKYFVEGCL